MSAQEQDTLAKPASNTDMLPFSRWPLLKTYLRSLRSFVPKASESKAKTVLVLGNPSADLDSFVSAVVYSYFHNHRPNATTTASDEVYIPLLNLPKTPASDLRRLRPEFNIAVQSAVAWREPNGPISKRSEEDSSDLDLVLTINDLTTSFPSTELATVFTPSSTEPPNKVPLVLVDHNAPSIPCLSTKQTSSRFEAIGCIDHHVDEVFIPSGADPRLIQMGIGSCTTLVVSYLREKGLFPSPSPNPPEDLTSAIALQQISTLALSSILIDTSNLTSPSKTSPLDHDIVTFLTSHIFSPGTSGGQFIHPTGSNAHAASVFLSRDYHTLLSDAKSSSLNNLSMHEVFERDYKQWSEPLQNPQSSSTSSEQKSSTVSIGISSLVQPISWLITHSGSAGSFASAINAFATSSDYNLDIFVFLTRNTPGRGKGLGMIAFSASGLKTLRNFERKGRDVLGLDRYSDDDESKGKELDEAMRKEFGGNGDGDEQRWRVWYMQKTGNTRKQIAPLARECVNGEGGDGDIGDGGDEGERN